MTDVADPPPPVTVTLPAWLITMTVLTGEEIRYSVVDRCVPGIDRPGLGLAEAGLAALVVWHPAKAPPMRPAVSVRPPIRAVARQIAVPECRSISAKYRGPASS